MKRDTLLRTLQILERYTDNEHTLKQQDIIDHLKRDFDIECDRRVVSRNLSSLKECGYDIVTTRSGICLLTRRYERSELRLLIDGVLSSRYIDRKHSEDLLKKLLSEDSCYFSESGHLSDNANWYKTPNKSVFYTIEVLDEAIAKKKKVMFMYSGFDLAKNLIPLWKKEIVFSPYFLVLHNQRYYLICAEEGSTRLSYLRVDRITQITLLNKKATDIKSTNKEGAFVPEKLDTAFPYFLNEEPEQITLRCHKSVFSDLVDWFGTSFTVDKKEGDFVEIHLSAPERAMQYWALQYGENVEVLSPISFRKKMQKVTKKIALKYSKKRAEERDDTL